MSSLIDPLTKCWMVDDALLSYNDSVVLMVYLVLGLEIARIPYMSVSLFDTRLIGLEVSDLAQLIIGSSSQPYEGY